MSELVEYEGDVLSLVKKPPRDCRAVIKARNDMLGIVDLNGFLSNLDTVGKFIRIAYNGVAGETELQITMRELGFDIAKLCDDSGLTMCKFRTTADSILTDFTSAYQFFVDDMEEMAIETVGSIGTSAKEMAEASKKLCKRFEDEKNKVFQVCKTTARKQGMEERDLKQLDEKEKQMKVECKRQMEEKLRAAEEEKKLQKEIESAIAEEEKVAEKLAPNTTDVALGVLTFGIYPTYRLKAKTRALALSKMQVKIDRLLQNKVDESERRREALKQMGNCAKEIALCSNNASNIRDQAIPALHGAVGALSNLTMIMQNMTTFWESMQQICEEQSKGKLEKVLEKAQKYEDPEKRLKVYHSSSVKTHALKMYVSWVAIESLCDDFIKKIKVSREELYSYLCENPTIEESKKRIHLLCREFKEMLVKEDAKIMKQIEDEKKKVTF